MILLAAATIEGFLSAASLFFATSAADLDERWESEVEAAAAVAEAEAESAERELRRSVWARVERVMSG